MIYQDMRAGQWVQEDDGDISVVVKSKHEGEYAEDSPWWLENKVCVCGNFHKSRYTAYPEDLEPYFFIIDEIPL